MIKLQEKKDCCGCFACLQKCPKHCISLEEDDEGFLYPKVDIGKCIDCRLCEKVCPVVNRGIAHTPLKVYAAKNKNREKRELSSSGGLFIALAERVIADGGVVFGVVFDERWEAHHVAATTMDEVQPMMRSKYIQSRTENTFSEAEQYLKQGRQVMYTGTSCQIAGLKRFLHKHYDNLLAVDVICHGVPSPGVWRKYLEEEVNKSARSAATGKNTVLNYSLKPMSVIADISFREKSRSGFDWQKYGFVVWKKSAVKGGQNSVLSSYELHENPYMRGFLNDLYLRPSCYACPAKGGNCGADITIADFWGINKIMRAFYDRSGVGLAVVYTGKGQRVFSAANIEAIESTIQEATEHNRAYWRSTKYNEHRLIFFDLFKNYVSVELSVDKCIYPNFVIKFREKLKQKAKRAIRLLLNQFHR